MITEKTGISLAVVVIFLSGVVWLSSVFAQVRHNGKDIDELKLETRTYIHFVESIDRRLSRIEGKLDITKGE